jgi:hypothetical protein
VYKWTELDAKSLTKNTTTESAPNKPGRRRQRSQILGSSNQSGGNRNSGQCVCFSRGQALPRPHHHQRLECQLAVVSQLEKTWELTWEYLSRLWMERVFAMSRDKELLWVIKSSHKCVCMGHYLPKVLACGILNLARRQLLAPLSCGDYKNELDWKITTCSH